jgi:hypothetical protein
MRANDPFVHTKRHSKIVGVKNELFHLGLEHFRGQPKYYHAGRREASGRPNCPAAEKYLLDSTIFRRMKRESQPSVRIFETTRTTNNEENMNAP